MLRPPCVHQGDEKRPGRTWVTHISRASAGYGRCRGGREFAATSAVRPARDRGHAGDHPATLPADP